MTTNEQLARAIGAARRIVFFGGAGVSTESGIPDFRSGTGLYHQQTGLNYRPEQILSRPFFDAHPDDFFAYYRANLLYPDARPNPAHLALAALERRGTLTAVITQNIDGLHQAAGSRVVWELHGSVHRNHCLECRRSHTLAEVAGGEGIPRCRCGGMIKPDVVLFEEPLDRDVIEGAVHVLERADLLIVGGTSLVVFPAARLLNAFNGTTVMINRGATILDAGADLVINAPIGETLAPFV